MNIFLFQKKYKQSLFTLLLTKCGFLIALRIILDGFRVYADSGAEQVRFFLAGASSSRTLQRPTVDIYTYIFFFIYITSIER